MKSLKVIPCLVLVMLPVFTINAQVTVKLHRPPPNKLMMQDLWHVDLNNRTSETYWVYLHGEVTEENDGLVGRANSNPFALQPGTKRITSGNIGKVTDTWYKGKYKESVVRTGNFPGGKYTVCVSVIGAESKEEFGRDCSKQNVQLSGKPRLTSPGDGAEIKKNPLFTWTPPTPRPPADFNYKLRIVKVLEGQTKEEAIQSNPSWFEKDRIVNTVFRYPSSARSFEEGTYAWQIQILEEVTLRVSEDYGKSEIRAFVYAPGVDIIEPISINIISPQDGEKIVDPVIDFEWTPVNVANISYSLTIWKAPEGLATEIPEGHRLNKESLADFKPYFHKEGIEEASFIYLKDANEPLEPGFTYAWQVKAWVGNQEIGRSKISVFSLKTEEFKEIVLDYIIPDYFFSGTKTEATLTGKGFIEEMNFKTPFKGIDILEAQFQDSQHYRLRFEIDFDVAPGNYAFQVTSPLSGVRINPSAIALNVTKEDCDSILKEYNAFKDRYDNKVKNCDELKKKVSALRARQKVAEQVKKQREDDLKKAEDELKKAKKALDKSKKELKKLINRAIHSNEVSTDPRPGLDNWLGIYNGKVRIYFSGSETSINILLWFLREYRDQWNKLRDECKNGDKEMAKWEKSKQAAEKRLKEAEAKLNKINADLKNAVDALNDCLKELKKMGMQLGKLKEKHERCLKRLEEQRACQDKIKGANSSCEGAKNAIDAAQEKITEADSLRKILKKPCEEAEELFKEAKKLKEQAEKDAESAHASANAAKKAYDTGDLEAANKHTEKAKKLAKSAKQKAEEASRKAIEANSEFERCKGEEEAQEERARVEREEKKWLLENIKELGLIRSDEFWETPGLWDWLPDILQAPAGYGAEDLARIPIPTDVIKALGGLYNLVEVLLDPCTKGGMDKTIERLQKRVNSKTGRKYTWNEAFDKTVKMCDLLRKLKNLVEESKRK